MDDLCSGKGRSSGSFAKRAKQRNIEAPLEQLIVAFHSVSNLLIDNDLLTALPPPLMTGVKGRQWDQELNYTKCSRIS